MKWNEWNLFSVYRPTYIFSIAEVQLCVWPNVCANKSGVEYRLFYMSVTYQARCTCRSRSPRTWAWWAESPSPVARRRRAGSQWWPWWPSTSGARTRWSVWEPWWRRTGEVTRARERKTSVVVAQDRADRLQSLSLCFATGRGEKAKQKRYVSLRQCSLHWKSD